MVKSNNILKPLLIRADAGGATGTGHVMRMIALAQAYLRRGGSVAIASVACPEQLVARLRSHDIEHYSIPAKASGDAADAVETLKLAEQLGVEWLIVDGYHFDYAYQKAIKASELSLLCTDDHGYSDRWCCDAILNQNLDAENLIEYDNDIATFKRLLGAQFCLFRQEFLGVEQASKSWSEIHRLLITLGGSDPENATEATLELLSQACARPLEIRVLAGADNKHIDRLRAFESQHSIEVVQNARNMPEQYAWADGIISAGGSTCWEWLYLGLPGAIVTIADNQLPIVEALTEDRQAALPLGWFNEPEFENQGAPLSAWLDSPSEVCDAQVAGGIIDGFGADRVAGFLLGSKVMVREARMDDCAQYLVWANNPEVRKNSFSPDPISEDSHGRWFSKRISASDSCLLVVADYEGNDLGQVRFDLDEEKGGWVVDFSIDSQWRGGGYGKASLVEALNWMHLRSRSRLTIFADVLEVNPASTGIFEALEFHKVGISGRASTYSFVLNIEKSVTESR